MAAETIAHVLLQHVGEQEKKNQINSEKNIYNKSLFTCWNASSPKQ